MNKLEQAARQALGALVRAEAMYGQPNADIQTALREALDHIADADKMVVPNGYALVSIDALKVWGKYDEVRNACQFPAEQAEHEPVATHICNLWVDPITKEYVVDHCDHPIDELIPAYAAPVEPVKQEPVAWMWACTECGTELEDDDTRKYCNSCGYNKFYKSPRILRQEPVSQEPVAYMFKVKRTTKSITVLDEFAAIDYFPQDNEEIVSKEPLSYAAPVDAKAIREQALEEAAKVCDELRNSGELNRKWVDGRNDCAAAIRGLK